MTDKMGDTALHIASSSGHKNCFDALLARDGIDVSLLGGYRRAVLFEALDKGRVGNAESLLKKDIKNVNALDENGMPLEGLKISA